MSEILHMTAGNHSYEMPHPAYRLRRKGDGELVMQQLIIITTCAHGERDSISERWDDLPTVEAI